MPDIRHEVVIFAPARTVYEALTSQSGLSAWWTAEAKAEPVRDTIARFGFGGGYFKEMRIRDLEPEKRVQWTCIRGAEEWVGTTLSFELLAGPTIAVLKAHPEVSDQIHQGSGDVATLVTFHHDGWKACTPMFAECNYTWGRFLRSLKLLCETQTGTPWPGQHRVDDECR